MKKFSFNLVRVVGPMIALITFAGCSSIPQERALTEQARAEQPHQTADEVRGSLLQLIHSDVSLSVQERSELSRLVDDVFRESVSQDVLSNQKKMLLMKTLLEDKPDHRRINALKASIRKVQHRRTELILSAIDRMCKVMKLHPETADPIFNRFLHMDTRR